MSSTANPLMTLNDLVAKIKTGVALPQDDFLPVGGGGGGGVLGGITTNIPVLGGTSGTGSSPLGSSTTSSASSNCSGFSFLLSPSCWASYGAGVVGNQLLRIVLLILGLLAVAGAIYLYKGPGSQIVSIPARAVGTAARAVVESASSGGE